MCKYGFKINSLARLLSPAKSIIVFVMQGCTLTFFQNNSSIFYSKFLTRKAPRTKNQQNFGQLNSHFACDVVNTSNNGIQFNLD